MSFGYLMLSGGNPYDPGMMTFDGSTGYYSKTITASGNKLTVVIRMNRASFAGDTVEYLHRIGTVAVSSKRNIMVAVSSDATGIFQPLRNKLYVTVENSTATLNLCRLGSNVAICDGRDHVIFFSFDGDAGTAMLYVDGVNADDTGWVSRVAPAAGTVLTGSTEVSVGAIKTSLDGLTSNYHFEGQIGYYGHRQAYLTNPTDFYHPTLGLQQINETGWTQWGAQPLFWSATGKLDSNQGSAGNMVANGTITGPA